MEIEGGQATFLIDALEAIKGTSERLAGQLDVVPADLSASRGEVRVSIAALSTTSFNDDGKNKSQTEHARNWMEVGPDAPAATRALHEWAKFVIRSVKSPIATLAAVPEKEGRRALDVEVEGDLTLHGVTVARTVRLAVEVTGPPAAPTEARVRTLAPVEISLREHDIKPRDAVGKFLAGALERIGQKIEDRVQVSFEATLKRP